jgi:regulator of protease activity HflC (stomatin/prohibitin superfamily)
LPSEFQDKIRSEIREQHGKLSCDVSDIQVENIRLPRNYETAVRAKEAAREEIKVAKSEEPRLITQAKTMKREASTEAEITIQKANTNAR